jgi:predicted double-glycine peptidase
MNIARVVGLAMSLVLLSSHAFAGSVEFPLQVGGAYSVGVQSLKERRYAATTRQKYDFSCGSAAVSTLLTHHYGLPVDEQSAFQDMVALGDANKIRREGFSMLDMKRYLATKGFEADGFQASLDDLLQAGVPAIALINEKGYHHFVVIKGVREGQVLIGDPAAGTLAVPRLRFEAARVNAILFVVGNRRELALFNRSQDWAVAPSASVAGLLDGGVTASVTLPR